MIDRSVNESVIAARKDAGLFQHQFKCLLFYK
jgi:hypothetical protein